MISFDEVSVPKCTELNFSHNLVRNIFFRKSEEKIEFSNDSFLNSLLSFEILYKIEILGMIF